MKLNNSEKKPSKVKQVKKDDVDDGRVYADMSMIDSGLSLGRRRKKSYDSDGNPIEYASIELTKKEKREIAWGVIKAHLIYALMGIALLLIVFLFLIKFWLG
ncbi:MAG TPA: hypothetical protein VFD28_02205 [Candidatus Eisenbacteria bacterium]|nr:hypothetical protein [Candidatus Eisenbacteria bacterium]